MSTKPANNRPFSIRPAERTDVCAIVALLADDELGSRREEYADPLPERYYVAFEAIDRDANHQLVVAESGGEVVGTLQVSFLPYLTYRGGWRAQIEAVRIGRSLRGTGLGRRLVEWAIDRARERGCHVVQLTTDKTRPQALEFYRSLGFKPTHEGMKLHLETWTR